MTVAVVSTGGTIASTEDEGGDASPELTGADLVGAVPELDEGTDLVTEDFANVPSPHFTVEQMYDLARTVTEYDRDGDVDGVVITQGTDILEESAYFVDLCYDGVTPVVFTGAMRNPSLASPDGPANLLTAVRTAESEGARGRGALVAFNDRIHPASEVTKSHSMNPDTFRSPEFGPVGVRDEDRLVWRAETERTPALDPDPDALTNAVAALTATADMAPARIPTPGETEAVCLAATGAGHIPPGIIPPLEELVAEGTPLVATTRCHEGRLARSTYDFRGSEATLRELGAYYSQHNLQKTRIGAIVGLAADGLDVVFERP